MNKGMFHGWQNVFAFTFRQDTKGKFVKNLLVTAVLLFLGFASISVIMAVIQKKDSEKISTIAGVHVVNESDLTGVLTDQFFVRNPEGFPDLQFIEESGEAGEVLKQIESLPKDLVLQIENSSQGYRVTAYLPKESEISDKEADAFLEAFAGVMETAKLIASEIPMEKLVIAMSGISVNTLNAGENEKDIGQELMEMLVPAATVFCLYFVALVYGATMGNAVSVEKTSKLMEMMLTMVRPYSMVFGKVLALTTAAIVQILVWFASMVAGYFAGDYIAANYVNGDYVNYPLEVIKVLQESGVGSAFSIPSVVLCILEAFLAVWFFCLLAAAFGSLATKTEEVPQFMGYYTLLMVAGFLGAYMPSLQGDTKISGILRWIPFCSAFMLPGDTLVGKISLLQSGLLAGLLGVFTIVLVLITGKVYKNQLFYRGESILARWKKKR